MFGKYLSFRNLILPKREEEFQKEKLSNIRGNEGCSLDPVLEKPSPVCRRMDVNTLALGNSGTTA